VQLCIVHQIRNSIKYVSSKDQKEFMKDLKLVYQVRNLTKTKGGFSNENSLLKLLYMGILNAKEKWTQPVHNWIII